MTTFNWSYQALTDSLLVERLEKLADDLECRELDLSYNRLKRMPKLTIYRQFRNLKVLRFGKLDITVNKCNNFKFLDPSCIPISVTELDACYNEISVIGDLSQLKQLCKLIVRSNNISVLDPGNKPTSIKELDLSGNKISEIGDFSQYKQLWKLDVGRNNIRVLDPGNIPTGIKELYMRQNKLSEVGDFSQHQQLCKLDVGWNNISVLDPGNIPTGIKEIDVSHNKLSEVGDFSQHQQLCKLDAWRNNISVLDPGNIPISIWALRVPQNKLSEVGDFSQHKRLSILDVGYNKRLHTLHGLPKSVKSFSANKTDIQVIGKKCFHTSTYSVLHGLSTIHQWKLKHPPVLILNQGLDTVLEYYGRESVKTTQTSLVLLGPKTSGKSSLRESLIEGKPVQIAPADRTHMAEVKAWEASDEDTILIFDQSGHPIYAITSPILVAPNSIVLLVCDITKMEKKELDETSSFLRQSLQYHPENQVHIVLTHIDMIDEVSVKQNEEVVKQVLHKTIDGELQALTRHPLADDNDDLLKEKVSALLKRQRENMKWFLLSSKSYEGINELKKYLCQVAVEGRVFVPDKWVEFYKNILMENKIFLGIKNLQLLFMRPYSVFGRAFKASEIAQQFQSALQYFTDTGQFFFYGNVPILNEYVFHKKKFLMNILQACFHHDLRNVVDFANDASLRGLFQESQLELTLQQYEQEGLLSKKLLQFLLQKYGLNLKDQDVILELLKLFHICYPIDEASTLFFFPWFVINIECPSTIDPTKLWMFDKTNFSVQLDCVFLSYIPKNAFEMILVQLQKTAVQRNYGGERLAWKDGLLVQIGSLECIAVRKQDDSTISICVRGHIKDLKSIWYVQKDVHTDLVPIFEVLLGALKCVFFHCNHCMLENKHPKKKLLSKEVFQMKAVDVLYRKCGQDTIPSALVTAMPENSKKVAEHVESVEKYLASVCKEQGKPEKMLYLDCDELSNGVFELSWCWPQSEEDQPRMSGPVDMYAVVEYRQGEQWKQVSAEVQESPYRVSCNALEFRVAARNEYGMGEPLYVKPSHVVNADKGISETDVDQIKSNHEFFCGMTSVQHVILRLFSRGVISHHEKERLIRRLRDNSAQSAADELMETIYRLDYHRLYLFQKTLKETGQIVMAGTIPVHLEGAEPTKRQEEGSAGETT